MEPAIREERNRRWDEPFGERKLGDDAVDRILELPDFKTLNANDFPERLPLREIIANDGRLQYYKRGDVVLRKGDYGNSMFVVMKGSVVVEVTPPGVADSATTVNVRHRKSWGRSLSQLMSRRRPAESRKSRSLHGAWDGSATSRATKKVVAQPIDVDKIASEQPGGVRGEKEMFGELAALTRSPRTASIYAFEDDTELFELRWQGLRDIRNWSPAFKQRIDQLYQERGLANRLQECPIFEHLDEEALNEISAHSLFETYGNEDWTHRFKREIDRKESTEHIIQQEPLICEEGHHVDGLLLINNGFVRVTRRVDQGEQTIGHLSRNDFYGLEEISEATESANGGMMMKASLRAIGYVDIIRVPTHLVRKHLLPGTAAMPRRKAPGGARFGRGEEMRQGLMDFLVDHRFINGENAMVINLDRCVGCDDCVRACATAHDNNPRFVRHGNTFESAMVVNACMHCTDPVCLVGCPTGAIHRERDTGNVVINDNTCIGCATCANSCPYNNIRMVDIRDESGALMRDADGPIARATKCDLCGDQLTGPACVQACPHDALTRINIRDTEKLLKWLG